jgi:hypothetical protein
MKLNSSILSILSHLIASALKITGSTLRSFRTLTRMQNTMKLHN